MRTNDDNLNAAGDDRLLAGLRQLAEAIESRAYPGQAWPVRRTVIRPAWRVYGPPLAAAAAVAAAILLAALLGPQMDPVRIVPPVPYTPQVVQAQPQDEEWDIPAEIDPGLADLAQPALAAQLDLEIPQVSMPSLGGGAFTWSVPDMDLVPRIDDDRPAPVDNGQTQKPVFGKDKV